MSTLFKTLMPLLSATSPTNIFVSATNLSFLFFVRGKTYNKFLLMPMFASIIYHFFECRRCYGTPFKYEHLLHEIDRLFSYFAMGYVAHFTYYNPEFITLTNITIGVSAMLGLLISERDKKKDIVKYLFNYDSDPIYVSDFDFLFFHSIWHIGAFYILSLTQ